MTRSAADEAPRAPLWRRPRFVIGLLIFALAGVVALQNKERVAADVLIWRFESPFAVWLLGAFVAGVLAGLLLAAGLVRRRRKARE